MGVSSAYEGEKVREKLLISSKKGKGESFKISGKRSD